MKAGLIHLIVGINKANGFVILLKIISSVASKANWANGYDESKLKCKWFWLSISGFVIDNVHSVREPIVPPNTAPDTIADATIVAVIGAPTVKAAVKTTALPIVPPATVPMFPTFSFRNVMILFETT